MNREAYLVHLLNRLCARIPCDSPAAAGLLVWLFDQDDLYPAMPQSIRDVDDVRGVEEAVWSNVRRIAERQAAKLPMPAPDAVFRRRCSGLGLDDVDQDILALFRTWHDWQDLRNIFLCIHSLARLGYAESVALMCGHSAYEVAMRLSPDGPLVSNGFVVPASGNDARHFVWACATWFLDPSTDGPPSAKAGEPAI